MQNKKKHIQTKTTNYWTDEMRDALQKEFLKRAKQDSVVINPKEAFAYAYADYVIMPWKVNPEMRETIKTCLDVIKRLNGGGVDTWVDVYPDPSTLTAPGTRCHKSSRKFAKAAKNTKRIINEAIYFSLKKDIYEKEVTIYTYGRRSFNYRHQHDISCRNMAAGWK